MTLPISALESRIASGPTRSSCPCVPLLCGKDFFACAARAILDARQQILVTGWWMDVDIPLVRTCDGPTREMHARHAALGINSGSTAEAYPSAAAIGASRQHGTTSEGKGGSASSADDAAAASASPESVRPSKAGASSTSSWNDATTPPDSAFTLRSLLRLKA